MTQKEGRLAYFARLMNSYETGGMTKSDTIRSLGTLFNMSGSDASTDEGKRYWDATKGMQDAAKPEQRSGGGGTTKNWLDEYIKELWTQVRREEIPDVVAFEQISMIRSNHVLTKDQDRSLIDLVKFLEERTARTMTEHIRAIWERYRYKEQSVQTSLSQINTVRNAATQGDIELTEDQDRMVREIYDDCGTL